MKASSWKKIIESDYLVGGFKHFLFSIIYEIILPIDVHIFQDGYCATNQFPWLWFSSFFFLALLDVVVISLEVACHSRRFFGCDGVSFGFRCGSYFHDRKLANALSGTFIV